MRKTCILITCDYPYDTGESFLENEIDYLSRAFQNIYIFPINAHEGDKMTRSLPSNAVAFPVGCVHNATRIFVYAFRGLLVHNAELKIWSLNPKYMAANLYARGRSAYIRKFILEKITGCHIDCSDATIYSYWFADQALAAGLLKETLKRDFPMIKAVSRAHRYDLYWDRNMAGYLPYQDVSLRLLDSVHPCSDDGSNYLKKIHPEYSEKIATARLGTKDLDLAPQPVRTVFVTCCSLKKFKRISLFAEAYCALLKKNPECYWYCIGDGEELELIQSIVKNAHSESNVQFLGRLSNRNVLDFYRENAVSYFVNVSTTEGLPVSIMEAMSYGIPTIATDVGGSGEIVTGETGLLLPAELTADMLTDYLAKEISISKEEYAEKRQNARKMWEDKYSADKNYREWCDVLTMQEV